MALADRILDQSPKHGDIPSSHALVVGYRHSATRTLLNYRRLGAYTGAGLASGAVNITLFHIAVRAHVQTHVAWALAFEIGALLAFILHRHVTWRDRRVHSLFGILQQLWRAQAGALLALLLNL